MRWIPLALMLLIASGARAVPRAGDYLKKPATWYAGAEARTIAGNILTWQSDLGGWPKNVDTVSHPYAGDDRAKDLKPTFDNSATTDELRLLARILDATGEGKYRQAFLRGYDYILKAQYPTGGWPQFYPPDRKYHRYITFNDNAMVRIMLFLRESWTVPAYRFIDAPRIQAAHSAFDRGIGCILNCQIRVDGKLTAWCAQHDETTLAPRPARAFELVSISGAESVGIVRLLMSLDDPSPEVVRSVQGAVAWFQAAKLTGIKVVRKPDANAPKGSDIAVEADPSASPLWARFYEIGTNRPIFCDRDGVKKYSLAEIGYERRNGYSWLSDWPAKLLNKEYPAWKAKWAARTERP